MTQTNSRENPFCPTPGHHPPFFAGRSRELETWRKLVNQSGGTENALVSGLHGVGKTCLLQEFRRIGEASGWLWVAVDISQGSGLTEDDVAQRVLRDLAQAMSVFEDQPEGSYFDIICAEYERLPGLPSDKLKSVIGALCKSLSDANFKGIILAYDEAHNLTDCASDNEFPLSMLLETVNSLQKDAALLPVLLVLSGLPHVFDAMISTRTYSERMFHVMPLDRLSREDAEIALRRPGEDFWQHIFGFEALLQKAVDLSAGYPCFVQYFGRELVDAVALSRSPVNAHTFPSKRTVAQLDGGSFGARWAKLSEEECSFLRKLVDLTGKNNLEFSAHDISSQGRTARDHSLDEGDVQTALEALRLKGIVYPSGTGYYAFAVPLTEMMVKCRLEHRSVLKRWLPWGERKASRKMPSLRRS